MRRRILTVVALGVGLAGAGLAWRAHRAVETASEVLARLRGEQAAAAEQERLLQARLREATAPVCLPPPSAPATAAGGGQESISGRRGPGLAARIGAEPALQESRCRLRLLEARLRFRAFAASRKLSAADFERLLALQSEWGAAQWELGAAPGLDAQEKAERIEQARAVFGAGLLALLGKDGVAAYDRFGQSQRWRSKHVEPLLGRLAWEGETLSPEVAERLVEVFARNSAALPGLPGRPVIDWDGVAKGAESVLHPARCPRCVTMWPRRGARRSSRRCSTNARKSRNRPAPAGERRAPRRALRITKRRPPRTESARVRRQGEPSG